MVIVLDENILGKRLRLLRDKDDLKQSKVSKSLNISDYQLSRYESGKSKPDPQLIAKFADYYNVKTDYLLGRSDNPNPLENDDEFDPMHEINNLLKKYDIDQSGFFDIEKWKAVGPEGIKQLESYLNFIVNEAKKQEEKDDE